MQWTKRNIRPLVLVLLILALVLGYGYACRFFSHWPGYHSLYYSPTNYSQALAKTQTLRKALGEELLSQNSLPKAWRRRAGHLFLKELDGRMFPYWMGTKYHFYGKTTVPGRGKIACGYFVTTLLEDMGVGLRRNALAQMASEQMIRELLRPEFVKIYSGGKDLKLVLSDIRKTGSGVYVIGLDTHTGFIINDDGKISFVHASGRWPWAVVREVAAQSPALLESKYRVTGCLTCDTTFLKSWLER